MLTRVKTGRFNWSRGIPREWRPIHSSSRRIHFVRVWGWWGSMQKGLDAEHLTFSAKSDHSTSKFAYTDAHKLPEAGSQWHRMEIDRPLSPGLRPHAWGCLSLLMLFAWEAISWPRPRIVCVRGGMTLEAQTSYCIKSCYNSAIIWSLMKWAVNGNMKIGEVGLGMKALTDRYIWERKYINWW